jgi:ABC-2 type transport system permease protein
VPVYDRRYRGYEGSLLPPRAAIGTLLRFGLAETFSSRLTLILFIASCLPVLAFASVIYLANNLDVLVQAGIQVGNDFPRIREAAFFFFLTVQSGFAFLLAAFVGPTLVAPDVAHGAMPLYLSRPLSRWGYGLGKLSVLLVVLSLVTWLPGLLLVLLQASLGADGWLAQNWDLPFAVFLAAWVWILPVSLAALAISAWVRWRPLATAMLFILFLVLQGFGHAVNAFLDTKWGGLLILSDQIRTIWMHLFRADEILPETVVRALLENPLPLAACWSAIAAACLLSAWLFGLRIRAQETVR